MLHVIAGKKITKTKWSHRISAICFHWNDSWFIQI